MTKSRLAFYFSLASLNFSCGNNVETKDMPKDTRNYVEVTGITYTGYNNTSDQTVSMTGGSSIPLANWHATYRSIDFDLTLSANRLPVSEVTGGGSHSPFNCTSGTNYFGGSPIKFVLTKDGDSTRNYGTRISNNGGRTKTLLWNGNWLVASSDITVGTYTLHVLDGEDVEFFSAKLYVI